MNPPDGNQEARGSARLLGVQREVTQEVVGSAGPREMWGDVGQTNLIHGLVQNKKKWNLNGSAGKLKRQSMPMKQI